MDDARPAQPPREKFDNLLTDPRHYRGDLRLIWTAVRRGWLNERPQQERDVLVKHLAAADTPDKMPGLKLSDGRRCATVILGVRIWVDMDRHNQREEHAYIERLLWPDRRATGEPGRPWTRRHVSAATARALDARQLQATLTERTRHGAWLLSVAIQAPDAPPQSLTVRLTTVGRGFAGRMVAFVCPLCERRTLRLFPARGGCGCWRCAGLAYTR